MLLQFNEFIKKEKLFDKKDYILVAVSGGIDSAALCNLLYKAKYNFAIAHCNFQLRGRESNKDEKFTENLAKTLNVKFYLKKFNINKYIEAHKVSVQIAARELRYQWFEQVRKFYSFDYIVTAHHQNDEVETFFINLIRGTGITGLHGIKAKSGYIVRPLMFATKNDIESYVKKNNIIYREDSSNASSVYLRNKIRHKLIPLLKSFNPSIEDTVKKEISYFRQFEKLLYEIIESKKEYIVKSDGNIVKLDISEILSVSYKEWLLFELLKPYNFSGDVISKILNGLKGVSGKKYFSKTHVLLKDRTQLIISPIQNIKINEIFDICKNTFKINEPIQLHFEKYNISENFQIIKDPNIAMLDFHKLEFPLFIRKWRTGDSFCPFGMKGKKKLSDFFTDIKLSLFEKEKIWVLCNGCDIVWIPGYRIDNRYCITSETKKVYVVKFVC